MINMTTKERPVPDLASVTTTPDFVLATKTVPEVEFKFIVPTDLIITDRFTLDPAFQVGSHRDVVLHAAYWDTLDFRLASVGHTLRHREERDAPLGIWTAKIAGEFSRGEPMTRVEVTVVGPSDSPPASLLLLFRASLRGSDLRPVATLVTNRTETDVIDIDGTVVVRIDDDTVCATTNTDQTVVFREVEIEVQSERGEKLARRIGKMLRHIGGDDSESSSKLARVLGDRVLPLPVSGENFARGATIGTIARSVVGEALHSLAVHYPGTRLGDNSEELHLCRVAVRRLRSDLGMLAPLLDVTWVSDTRSELGWLASSLGAVRDLDVLGERLTDQILRAQIISVGSGSLLHAVAEQRRDARINLIEALDSERFLVLLQRLEAAWLYPPTLDDETGEQRADSVVRGLAKATRTRTAKAVKSVRNVPEDVSPGDVLPGEIQSSDEALHLVRRRSKHERYAVELAARTTHGATHRDATRHANLLRRVQDVLGDFQDAKVALSWLVEQGRTSEPAVAFAAGELAQLQRRAIRCARNDWSKVWRHADSKRVREWLG